MAFVGVFDSGIGGLTVLQKLRAVAPTCDFLYIADHAFCPYGTKSAGQICHRALLLAQYLQDHGAQSIVIACNTASVFAEEIRRATHLPVLDVIFPTCQFVARSHKRVALLATQLTVQSGAYQHALAGLGVEVVPFACGEFVPLVEDAVSEPLRMRAVSNRLKLLSNLRVDAVVLGCTHFPFLQKEISACCHKLPIVSCAEPVADVFASTHPSQGSGNVLCYTTGAPRCVLGYNLQHIKISDGM